MHCTGSLGHWNWWLSSRFGCCGCCSCCSRCGGRCRKFHAAWESNHSVIIHRVTNGLEKIKKLRFDLWKLNGRLRIHDKASLEISDTGNIQEESAAKLICVYVKTIESLPNLMNNENEIVYLTLVFWVIFKHQKLVQFHNMEITFPITKLTK